MFPFTNRLFFFSFKIAVTDCSQKKAQVSPHARGSVVNGTATPLRLVTTVHKFPSLHGQVRVCQ